jgi:DNA-binding NarL/FixJ family response regulator
MPERRARVLLADDHELAREALRSVLAREHDLEVVGEAVDGPETVALAARRRPDIVMMDLRMPGLDGLAATRAILAEAPATRVVVLTSSDTRSHMLEAIGAGAAGFLPKGATRAELLLALRSALAGEVRAQVGGPEPGLSSEAKLPDGTHGLTPREVEVLRLVARGRTNEAIAHELGLTANTVKTHVAHVLRKLAAPDCAAAVARAASLGLLA